MKTKKQDTHKNILPHNSWRSGGDSNPRTGDPSNDLANRPLQPLEYRSAQLTYVEYTIIY